MFRYRSVCSVVEKDITTEHTDEDTEQNRNVHRSIQAFRTYSYKNHKPRDTRRFPAVHEVKKML